MGIPHTTSHHVQVLSPAHTGHPGRGGPRLQSDDDEEDGEALLRPDVLGQGQAAPAPRAMPQKMVMKPVHSYHVPTYSIVSPYQFTRYHHLGRRATPEEETAEFLNDWVDFQGDLEHKIGNLTCVFDKMGLHTASGDVNLRFFTTDFWNNINLDSTLAGSDPAWRSMLTTKWTDCYNKAQAIPTETLTRMSFMKSMPQLARNM